MKYLAVLSLLAFGSAALATDLDNVDTSPYTVQAANTESDTSASTIPKLVSGILQEGTEPASPQPTLSVGFDNRLHMDYNRLGAWLWQPQDSGFRLGVVASLRRNLDQDPAILPVTLEEQNDAMPAGISAAWASGAFVIEAAALTDVADQSNGEEFTLHASYRFIETNNWTVSAAAKIESLDENVVDFYYGTRGSDSSNIRHDPESETSLNGSIQLLGTYNINRQWALTGSISATALGSEVDENSPVDSNKFVTALFGATYRF